ncbi:hypothetical protein YYG_04368 [Plasmodium vinckei petteri]|uniref:Uncharacterized protein n=1 Tax=Plasmodium vinckei petteri TaxID=138298 RepID=W7ANR6_PLAVN|nr:hypothetical protein YYG_04368 [Plasmodium vinckei petteri]CAD2111919.1 conserved Plasmodium protein, unknown function [Plasmodium vinckei petteri]
MFPNNGFNGGVNQMNSYQNNNTIPYQNNNENFYQNNGNIMQGGYNNGLVNNMYGNDFMNKNMNNYNNDIFGNSMNNMPNMNNGQNQNNFYFSNKNDNINIPNQKPIFTQTKQNVSIFGNKPKNTPLFANNNNNIRNEPKFDRPNQTSNFRFNDYVGKDKSIFGNRIKEGKSLFANSNNMNQFPNSVNNNMNYGNNINYAGIDNSIPNNNYVNYNCDSRGIPQNMMNPCNFNDPMTKNMNFMMNAQNNKINNNPYMNYNMNSNNSVAGNFNIGENNSTIPGVNNLSYNMQTNLAAGGNTMNIGNFNNMNNPYNTYDMEGRNQNMINYPQFNTQSGLNMDNKFINNNVGTMQNYQNMLQNNNMNNAGNFGLNNPNLLNPHNNPLNSGIMQDNNKNIMGQNYNFNNPDFRNQIIQPTSPDSNPNYNNNTTNLGIQEMKNDTKNMENKNNEDNGILFTNENEIMFEKNYAQIDKTKKIKFFNENFIKSLELINNHNLNSYNENRSTIYTFPISQLFNNASFYLKAIEECKKGERFDVDSQLFDKIFSKNISKNFTVLKNIDTTKINEKDFDLSIYYPLLHVEKIKFRKPSEAPQNINQLLASPFELGKIPTVI